MAISVNFDRPKLDTTTAVAESLDVGTVTSIVGPPEAFEVRVFLDDIAIDPQTVAADPGISWAATTITGPGGTFNNVRPGDVVSSATGFVSGQIVQTVSTDGTTVTTDVAADVDTNNELLTFTPGTLDATVYYLRLEHAISGTTLRITPKISLFDGTLVEDGTTNDGSDDVTYDDGSITSLSPITINLDTYLTNARQARTN